MATVPDIIQTAIAHHQAGRLDDAERAYRLVLQSNPRDAGVVHLLGLLAFQRGDHDAGLRQIAEAIRLDANQAVFHANLGEVYRALGRLADARTCYEKALLLNPDVPEANNNLGTILQAERRTDEAISCYQKAIAARPDYADAHNNLGTAFQDRGEWDAAVECFRRAVAFQPGYIRGYYNLGVAHEARGQLPEAVRCFERAIRLDGSYAEAHYGLALVLQRCNRHADAEAAYRRALQLRPDWADANSSLGSLLQAQGKLAEAIELYEQALRLRPEYAEAHYNLGTALVAQGRSDLAIEKYRHAIELKPDFAGAHYNLGTVLQELGNLDEAAAAYQRAISYDPRMTLAHNNLGNIYQQQNKTQEAIACYQRALQVDPRHCGALNNLGTALQGQGRLSETLDCFRQAIASKPQSAEAYCNLGTALHLQGDAQEALECFARCLEIEPDSAEGHYNRALLYLGQQRFEEGWSDFAWRLKCKKYPVRHFDQSLWDGEPFRGKTLLVHAEQGFGDTFQFVRYLKKVRALGGRVFFEVQPQLVPLLSCSGVEGLVDASSHPASFDLYAPILSLPGLLKTTLENMPRDVPYLAADAERSMRWGEKLSQIDGFKVGINWQGNRAYRYDRFRSIPLNQFAPLARVPGVSLFSLQKRDGGDQVSAVADEWKIHDLAPQLDETTGAFMDTAAVMENLDLVITSDTATAHLAGALGVPVWVALSSAPEWRWFLGRDDSPWYPTMRLFRQTVRGDWAGVFKRMAQALAELAAAR